MLYPPIRYRSKNILQYEIGMSLDILEVSFLVVQFGGDTDLWLRTCEASQSISRSTLKDTGQIEAPKRGGVSITLQGLPQRFVQLITDIAIN